jgi:hypothetical protein
MIREGRGMRVRVRTGKRWIGKEWNRIRKE